MSNKYPVAYAVGQKIKSLRKSQGYTVFQLAKEIDISEQQLFRYERGVNRIDIDCLVKVLDVLGINIGNFFEDVMGVWLMFLRIMNNISQLISTIRLFLFSDCKLLIRKLASIQIIR
ncbi:helix-turn-helix domain-containing protein [Proteus mirabilis]|uniref:helix-turn-helix domain-containing protein n=1 Tax=Proteus mirabilis TaxID=584 RepID=UPI000ADE46B1|nr:helix-turn-helix transcriptional regulator [Proteus mirabilis]